MQEYDKRVGLPDGISTDGDKKPLTFEQAKDQIAKKYG
jgi:hypothetical protein